MGTSVADLSEVFADEITSLCYGLMNKKKEHVLSKQLLKAGTSIGANIREAKYGQSRADFVSKMNIALKEAGESEYWLKRLHNAGFIEDALFSTLHAECSSIIRILTKIVKNSK